MSTTPASRNRIDDVVLMVRATLASWGPMPKKKYSMAMLVDEVELRSLGLNDFKLVNEFGIRPLRQNSTPKRAPLVMGISAKRRFQRKEPRSTLAVWVTPCTSEEIALASVKQAEASIVRNPFKPVKLLHLNDTKDLEINGLQVFTHEASLRIHNTTHQIQMIVSHVGSVVLWVHTTSLEFWRWEDVVSVATLQAEKIRRNEDVLPFMFD
jgi:UDP-N-acetylglucosamine transferase subunit ALG13